ncbi:N/A [soil metagenome]
MNQHAGIGRYARGIAGPLAAMLAPKTVNWWYAGDAAEEPPAQDLLHELSKSQHHRVERSRLSRTSVNRLYFRLGLPVSSLMKLGNAKTAYSPDFTVPSPRGSRTAITIHDLAWQVHPELAPAGLRRFLDQVVPSQLAKADRVFTVSEATRIEILERFQIEESRIVVAPNAADDRFFQRQPGNSLALSDVSLPEDYVLMVGSIEPRKNHVNVLQAVGRVPDCPALVIVGGRGWDDDEIWRRIMTAEPAGGVHAKGHVPDQELAQLYAGARAVISASWYEGFGLPVLEGLASGVRVVASDIPAHREVAGPYAVYVQPGDVESIADGIIRALEMGKPVDAEKLGQQGWARRFSWSQSAGRVHQTLLELL